MGVEVETHRLTRIIHRRLIHLYEWKPRLSRRRKNMCQGMSGDEQIRCLCPNPLPYTLTALPSPKDNNYSTCRAAVKSRISSWKADLTAAQSANAAAKGLLPGRATERRLQERCVDL